MAFKQDVTAVNPNTQVQAQAGDTSTAQLLSGVNDFASLVGGVTKAVHDDQVSLKSDKVASDALSGILDLQEERDFALGIQDRVNTRLQELGQDGITADEEEELKALQVELNFLDEAKKTGVLSRQGYSTRFNALRRAAMSSAENLGIQTNIAKIFDARRSLVAAAPVIDPATQVIETEMDSIHGKGQWTALQAAEYAGKKVAVEAELRSLNAEKETLLNNLNWSLEQTFHASMRDVESRNIITKEEAQSHIDLVIEHRNVLMQTLDEKVQKLKANNMWNAAAQKGIEAARKSVIEQTELAASAFDEGGRHEKYTAKNVYQNIIDGQKLVSTYRLQEITGFPENFAKGMGPFGKMGTEGMKSLLAETDENDRILTLIAQNAGMPNENADSLRSKIAQYMALEIAGGTTVVDLRKKGLATADEARFMVNGVSLTEVTTKEEAEKKVDFSETLFVPADSTKSTTANIQQYVGSIDRLISDSRAQGTSDKLRLSVQNGLKQWAVEIKDKFGKKTGHQIFADENGNLFTQVDPRLDDPAISAGLAGDSAFQDGAEMLASYRTLVGKAIEEGLIEPSEIQKHFDTITQEDAFGVDGFTGAGETGRAAVNRSVDNTAQDQGALPADQEPASTGTLSEEVGQLTSPPPVDDVQARVAWEENRNMDGFDQSTGLWTPHKSFEGGNDTLAYGHKLTDEERDSGIITLSNGQQIDFTAGISEADAQNIFNDDLLRADKDASRVVSEHGLDQALHPILQNMAFQLGTTSFREFKKETFPKLEKGDYKGAAKNIMKSKWAKDTPARANRIATDVMALGLEDGVWVINDAGDTITISGGRVVRGG